MSKQASPSLNSHFPIHWGARVAWCPVPHRVPDTTSSANTSQMDTPAGHFYPLVPTSNHKAKLSWGFRGVSGVQASGRGLRKMWFAGYSILSSGHSGNSSLGVSFPFSCWALAWRRCAVLQKNCCGASLATAGWLIPCPAPPAGLWKGG